MARFGYRKNGKFFLALSWKRRGSETLVLVRLPVEDRMSADGGNIGLLKKRTYGTRETASNWECDWQEHVKSRGYQLGLSSKNMFRHEENRVSGLTHGDDFVLMRQAERLTEFENVTTAVCLTKAKLISYGSSESTKAARNRLSA